MLRPGHVIALAVVALLTLGVVMVNSAGMTVEARQAVSIESILLSRSTAYMGLALLAMVLCALLPVLAFLPGVRSDRPSAPTDHPLGGWVLWPLWIGVAFLIACCLTAYLPGLGREVNGSHRWIRIAGQSVQPSEIAKWGLVGLMAWYVWRSGPRLGSFLFGLAPGLAAAGAVAGFVALEDLGTGVLLGLTSCVILLAGGARWWQLSVVIPAGLLAFAALVVASPYRVRRLTAFLDPYADPLGIGYHTIQSLVAVANGQVTGRGLGFGQQKFGYLPEDQTDFVFAIICEELGLAGAAMVVGLYLAILWAGYLIIRAQSNLMLKLIGTGIIATVGIQAIVNMCVVTGMGPAKGIALPLLSSGGTGWILTAGSLGLIISMDRLSVFSGSAGAEPVLVEPRLSVLAALGLPGGPDGPGSAALNVEPSGQPPREPEVRVMPSARAGILDRGH
ncbi:MAG: cell division protein FtsW [Phycisphaeraceae bacterium]|nr:cell division protein FtsW [Phycisphaeraceae bacterium]